MRRFIFTLGAVWAVLLSVGSIAQQVVSQSDRPGQVWLSSDDSKGGFGG